MAYSDLEMRAFTQIAYMDFGSDDSPDSDFLALKLKYGDKVPLSELLSNHPDYLQKLHNMGINDKQINSWSIVNIHNKTSENENGFYGCMIETAPGEATLAFRGSEGFDDVYDAKTDWSDADLALLNSVITKQENEAKIYLEELKGNGIWDQYDSVSFTGHSLGGELAEYAAIISVRLGMDDKITQCVSMDGPGHSAEFLEEYKDEIQRIAPKMDHPRWSCVGNLLFDLPGVNYRDVKVSDKAKWKLLTRHDTKYLCFDDNGNLLPGSKDLFSIIMSYTSKGIDYLPSIIGNTMNGLLRSALIGFAWVNEKELLGFFTNIAVVVVAPFLIQFAAKLILFPVPTLISVLSLLAIFAIIPTIGYVYHFTIELIHSICNSLIQFGADVLEKIGTAYNWAKEKIQEYKDAFKTGINKLRSCFEKNFGGDGNPYYSQEININTYSLHMYSGRLRDVNRRITYVDSRLDTLYGRVGLKDLWNLLQADLLTGFSWKLLRCSEYLDVTANEFDRIETKLIES